MENTKELVSVKQAARNLSLHYVTLLRKISILKEELKTLPIGVFPIGRSYRIDIELFKRNFSNNINTNEKTNFHKLRQYFETESAYYKTISKKTVKNHQRSMVLASEFFYKHEFTNENLFRFRNWLIKEKNMAEGSVKKYLNGITAMGNVCFECGLLKENITVGIKKGLKVREIERFLTKEEREKLRAYVTNTDVLEHIEFAIETGLRKGEQFGLEWQRIDLQKKEIYIVDRKNGKSLTIPISNSAVKILEKRKNLSRPFRNIYHYEIKTALSEANIYNFRWHDLRHTFATWCAKGWHNWLNSPLSLDKIQKLLGHSRIAMTERYSHLDASDLHVLFIDDKDDK